MFYCVCVFALTIQNIIDNYSEIQKYREKVSRIVTKRIAAPVSGAPVTPIQGRSNMPTSNLMQLAEAANRGRQIGSDQARSADLESGVNNEEQKDPRSDAEAGKCLTQKKAIPQKLEMNEFIVEALLRTGVIVEKVHLDPIRLFLKGLTSCDPTASIDRSDLDAYVKQFQQVAKSGNGERDKGAPSSSSKGRHTDDSPKDDDVERQTRRATSVRSPPDSAAATALATTTAIASATATATATATTSAGAPTAHNPSVQTALQINTLPTGRAEIREAEDPPT
jgi:hypothetical protein